MEEGENNDNLLYKLNDTEYKLEIVDDKCAKLIANIKIISHIDAYINEENTLIIDFEKVPKTDQKYMLKPNAYMKIKVL